MNMTRLFQALSAIHSLTEDFKIALEKETTHLSLPKCYMLLEAPKIAEHAYFINSGFAMSYTFIKGKKQVESLWTPGEIIVSARSFFERIPSVEYIQLMEQSDVLHISYASVLRLFDSFEEAKR